IKRIEKSIGVNKALVQRAALILIEEYEKRGMMIQEVANGLKLVTNPDVAEHLELFFQIERRRRISRAALQTLSIIAYNQPVTKAETESFRGGINSSGVLQSLLERDLIKIAGRKETPGNPYLYSVSDSFLDYFGLKNIDELKEKLPAVEDELAKDGGTAQLKLRDLGMKSGTEDNSDGNGGFKQDDKSDDLSFDSFSDMEVEMDPEPDEIVDESDMELDIQ
ncbi:SMC-Scp complex subunit ScpB, partial [bacterium]|nr:SMC-Scp complex subunit ScpB [bacterium]MBU1025202.1 SMC-Scp complex subunit ScpB [bacterium]